jgi:hypothetical protein
MKVASSGPKALKTTKKLTQISYPCGVRHEVGGDQEKWLTALTCGGSTSQPQVRSMW